MIAHPIVHPPAIYKTPCLFDGTAKVNLLSCIICKKFDEISHTYNKVPPKGRRPESQNNFDRISKILKRNSGRPLKQLRKKLNFLDVSRL